MKKTVDLKSVRESRENLAHIAREHPELIDHETPEEELAGEWRNILEGILKPDKMTFTIEEAAELLSCHKDTVRRAIKAGKLKAAKFEKGYRISKLDLEDYYKRLGGGQLFQAETQTE